MPSDADVPAPIDDERFLRELDPVRRALVLRMRERGFNYAILSREIRKNPTYVHQYITKKSPRSLNERDRIKIASLLEMPEVQLRDPDDYYGIPPFIPLPMPKTVTDSADHSTDLPVLSEGDEIDVSRATEWTSRPPSISTSGNTFALWIIGSHGRLRPGDMAYVRFGQPPRIGDTVVLVAGKRVLAIGDLTRVEGTFVVDGANFPLDGHRALKVIGALFA